MNKFKKPLSTAKSVFKGFFAARHATEQSGGLVLRFIGVKTTKISVEYLIKRWYNVRGHKESSDTQWHLILVREP